MTVAVAGYSIACAQGATADEIYHRLQMPLPAVRRIIDFLGQTLDLPYYAAFGDDKLSLDALCQLLAKHAQAALVHAGYGADALQHIPIFLASTSFHIADYERQSAAVGDALRPDYALHQLGDYFVKQYANPRVFTCATSCTSAANALIYAKNFMDCGWCDSALVLAFETFNDLTLSHFQALGLLSRDDYRPFTGGGMILGEGIAAMVLEKDPSTVRPFTLTATAATTDTDGLTSVGEAVLSQTLCTVLDEGQLAAADVVAVKANASGGMNDVAEQAVLDHFFPEIPRVCFKAQVGNTLGASALMEWILLLMCLERGILPGNRPAQPGYYLLHAFGFGGNSSALLMRYAP